MSVSSAELLQAPTHDSERWHRIVRALALRKFVLGAQDAVRVDRVVEAYRRCLIADEPAVQEMERAFHEIEEGIGANVGHSRTSSTATSCTASTNVIGEISSVSRKRRISQSG